MLKTRDFWYVLAIIVAFYAGFRHGPRVVEQAAGDSTLVIEDPMMFDAAEGNRPLDEIPREKKVYDLRSMSDRELANLCTQLIFRCHEVATKDPVGRRGYPLPVESLVIVHREIERRR